MQIQYSLQDGTSRVDFDRDEIKIAIGIAIVYLRHHPDNEALAKVVQAMIGFDLREGSRHMQQLQ